MRGSRCTSPDVQLPSQKPGKCQECRENIENLDTQRCALKHGKDMREASSRCTWKLLHSSSTLPQTAAQRGMITTSSWWKRKHCFSLFLLGCVFQSSSAAETAEMLQSPRDPGKKTHKHTQGSKRCAFHARPLVGGVF